MFLSVILLSLLMILLSTLNVIRHLICDNQNWLLNWNLIYGRLWTGAGSGKWLVDFNAGKTQLVSFDCSNITGAIGLKMDGVVLEEKSSFKMLEMTFSSKLDCESYIIFITKTASKKNCALIHSVKFLSLEFALYLYKFVIMSGLVLLVATWDCWISKNGYTGLLVLHLLPLLNPWLIVEM